MPELPIDPEFNRFIDGITDPETGDVEFELPDDDAELIENDDGSVTVALEEEERVGPEDNPDFYANLAESMPADKLSSLALDYINYVEKDLEARNERDKQYAEGIKRTGLGGEAPGGAQFSGASRAVHPVMAEGCVDFCARAIKELFPPDGPVRTRLWGEPTQEKTEVAERKRDYMNWQLTDQIVEMRDEEEQLLTQLPLGGSQYLRLTWSPRMERPTAEFVPIDNFVLPFAAANYRTAQRATEIQAITQWEFDQRVDDGLYVDVDSSPSSLIPEETAAEKATAKIEGKSSDSENIDGMRTVYHIEVWLDVADPKAVRKTAPYILMVDKDNTRVLGLYRNWESGDETQTKLDWYVEFRFIPWRGAYGVGLPHLIGSLSGAMTGALRALLDSAHINNAATMLKLKGAKISGQSQQVEVTQVAEIEGAPGVDDIRKIAMPFPFNPPSAVLLQLLGILDQTAKGVVTTAEEKIADANSSMPVGTTQALIEQGAVVFSAIHARLHASQRRVLEILQRLNRWYLDKQRRGESMIDLPIKREDFERTTDVAPVSDPSIFSETQRMAQAQSTYALAKENPGLVDIRVAVQRVLKQLKVPNIDELMPTSAAPIEMHAADENSAMMMGRNAVAYPRQDHIAHLRAHFTFAKSPVLGGNPLVAPFFVPRVLDHVRQHIALWYAQTMHTEAIGKAEIKHTKYAESKLAPEIDRTVALAAPVVSMQADEILKPFMADIAQLLQMAQQLAPKPQLEGEAQAVLQASLAETQRRGERDKADITLRAQEIAQRGQDDADDRKVKVLMNTENNLTKERMETMNATLESERLRREQFDSAIALQDTMQNQLKGGTPDGNQ